MAGIILIGIVVPGMVLVMTVYTTELVRDWIPEGSEAVTCAGSEGVAVLGLDDGVIAS